MVHEHGAASQGRSTQDEPQLPRTGEVPIRELDDRSLRTVFLTLLGRPPLADERERWLHRGLLELLDATLPSPEAWQHWFDEQLYYFLLIDNFRPMSEATSAIPEELTAGRLTVREALHRIALSPSFDLRNPGADTFVTVVMEQFVGATVQKSPRELEMGKSIYDGRRGSFLGASGESQADVVRIAIASREASRHFLAREHQRLFFADAESKDLSADLRRYHDDPGCYLEIVREWLFSPRWEDRLARPQPLPNRMFVRALFVDMLDRLPRPEEVEPIRNALDGLADSRPLRAVLVRLMLDSGWVSLPEKAAIADPAAWIEAEFDRLLGRGPRPDEVAAFVEAFRDPACRPQTVLLALLSDPDYHQY